jgi:hypothetical protein
LTARARDATVGRTDSILGIDPPHGAEAGGFVGRAHEVALLEDDLLGPEPVAPIVFVHGPGGIGKSALLREMQRRAEAQDIRVVRIDGRDPETAQELAPQLLEDVGETERSLVVLDSYEHVAALGALLRARLSAHLGVRARLLIAGRRSPEPSWFQDGWDARLRVVGLRPLSDDDSRTLLARRGLRDPAAIEETARWAAGSPLSLIVGADALLAGQVLDLTRLDADAALAEALIQRLAGDELEGADREVLAVAAIARAVDARMLAAVLPGLDGDLAEQWLRSRSFSEPFGVRVALHERVRKAARGGLLATDPELDRELRRRLADHLFGRAVLGELSLLPDLAELIDDPRVRWAVSPSHHAATHRFGWLEPGDAAALSARLDGDGTRWWQGVEHWIEHGAEHAVVVRDVAGEVAAFGIAVTPATAPEWAHEDQILGPWLADARSRYPDGDVLLLREGHDFNRDEGGPEQSPAIAVGNMALVSRSGLPTVRAMYSGLIDPTEAQRESVRALGCIEPPELTIVDGERTVRCYLNDFGPGGLVGWIRTLVYSDLGLPPPPERPPAAVGAETVRDALRSFRDARALARSPLARGVSTDARAASVRGLLREAVAASFGESEDERLLRSVLELGYVEPGTSHIDAQRTLHLSRANYFRRLRTGAERVCEHVLSARQE